MVCQSTKPLPDGQRQGPRETSVNKSLSEVSTPGSWHEFYDVMRHVEQVSVALPQAPGHRLHFPQERVDIECRDHTVLNNDPSVDQHRIDAGTGLGKHYLVHDVVHRHPPWCIETIDH